MVLTSLEKGAKLIISGAGLPLKLPEYGKDFPDVALVPLVSSVKAAALVYRRWEKKYGRIPDGLVVETPNYAGGHLGATHEEVGKDDYSLESVIPSLKEMIVNEFGVDIPIIAAGGIWDREDIMRMFSLGADGVQMATRFVCTEECDAPPAFKGVYLNADKSDVVLVKSPVGLPGRAIRNEFVRMVEEGKINTDGKCTYNCLVRCSYRDAKKGFCIATALVNSEKGNTEEGIIFAGSNALKCNEIISVKQLFRELTGEE
jgi:nitronate monooxygenase